MNQSTQLAKFDQKTNEYTSVIAHCFDVGAMAEQRLLVEPKWKQESLANGLGTDVKSAVAWLALVSGLHDLMKLSWAFQLMFGICDKYAELNNGFDKSLQAAIRDFRNLKQGEVSPIQHAILLPLVLPKLLHDVTGIDLEVARNLTDIATAHHGLFPNNESLKRASNYLKNQDFEESAFDTLRLDVVQSLWNELSFDGIKAPTKVELGVVLDVMGIVVHSDWLGSRSHRFPLQNGDCRPFVETREIARQVTADLGIKQCQLEGRPSFADMGLLKRPMQEQVESMDLTGPFCMFIKGRPGCGKTAAGFQSGSDGRGFLLGAHAQSTANSIHGELAEIIRHCYPSETQGLHLAHSNRGSVIEDHIQSLIEDDPSNKQLIQQQFELQSEGLQDALTGKFVVATIDQILMSIFNDGSAVFRLHWLMSKANILDEVHTLDGRLEALLLVYLEICGRFKTPVVLLSATISSVRMNRMLAAWAKGAGYQHTPVELVSQDEVILCKPGCLPDVRIIPDEPHVERKVQVEFFERNEQAMVLGTSVLNETEARIIERLKESNRIAYLAPTKKSAQHSFSQLAKHVKDLGAEPICFHAGFTPIDKTAVTKRLFELAGTDADNDSRVVLFATSVMREGLNIDLDELITFTGLADDIIQAQGRIHRFNRPDRQCKQPRLHLLHPWIEQKANGTSRLTFGDADFIHQCRNRGDDFGFRGATQILSCLFLRQQAELTLPTDGQSFVDFAYDLNIESIEELVPDEWKQILDQFVTRQKDAIDFEHATILQKTIPIEFDLTSTDFRFDDNLEQFLSSFTTFKLFRQKHRTRLIDGSLSFFVEDTEDSGMVHQYSNLRDIAMRTVNVSNMQRIAAAVQSQLVPAEWQGEKCLFRTVARLVKDIPVFVRNAQSGQMVRICYSSKLGLQID